MNREEYYAAIQLYKSNSLQHHGILGQKWGHRNGPPYPLSGGDYSKLEKQKMYKHQHLRDNSIYNKKHFDKVISKSDTLSTLSWDPNRTKNTDMFFAAFDKLDKSQYMALFNKKTTIDGSTGYKWQINNKVKDSMKVASEDSATKVFKDLYTKDRDFYNFVSNRLISNFDEGRLNFFKGYREGHKSINKIGKEQITEQDVNNMYRMFNYVIPVQNKDVQNQRQKFFKAMKKAGYGAILDTNDAIYGGFKAKAPVIVFDMDSVVPDSLRKTTIKDKPYAHAALIYRKIFGK